MRIKRAFVIFSVAFFCNSYLGLLRKSYPVSNDNGRRVYTAGPEGLQFYVPLPIMGGIEESSSMFSFQGIGGVEESSSMFSFQGKTLLYRLFI